MSTGLETAPAQYSLAEFVSKTSQQDRQQGFFELENPYTLEVNLNPSQPQVWTKAGSMIAYRGDVKFTREGMLEHGIGKALKRAVSGEGIPLMKGEGTGTVYLADAGKRVAVIRLAGESLVVNGYDLLAFEGSSTIQWDIKMMKKVAGMLAGGLSNITVSGHGLVAITSHYTPLTLKVSPGNPVFTDPGATIAWSANLEPEIKTDISLKTFIGRSSGESIQMKFDGDGFVVVQPYEETYYAAT